MNAESLYINPQSKNILGQIAAKINSPIQEIIRLNKYKTESDEIDAHSAKHVDSIILKNSEEIAEIIKGLVEIERNKRIEIVIHENFKYPDLLNIDRISKPDLEWLMEFEKTVLSSLDTYGLNIAMLASKLATSERQIFRKIEKYVNCTPRKYISKLKLRKAKEYLESYVFSTIKEVAIHVGFKDVHYFTKLFKTEFNRSPKSYFG